MVYSPFAKLFAINSNSNTNEQLPHSLKRWRLLSGIYKKTRTYQTNSPTLYRYAENINRFRKWRLQPDVSMYNKLAGRELTMQFKNASFIQNKTPKYLIFKEHFTKTYKDVWKQIISNIIQSHLGISSLLCVFLLRKLSCRILCFNKTEQPIH